jgi:hypothetical protein
MIEKNRPYTMFPVIFNRIIISHKVSCLTRPIYNTTRIDTEIRFRIIIIIIIIIIFTKYIIHR